MTAGQLLKILAKVDPDTPVCVDDPNYSYETETEGAQIIDQQPYTDRNGEVQHGSFVSLST